MEPAFPLSKILVFVWILGSPFFLHSQAQLLPDFHLEVVLEDLEKPVGIRFDDRERMYFWTKTGKVYVVENGVSVLFLDISEEVADIGDNGLTGFVFHPDFLQNGYVYLIYTVDRYHLDFYGTPGYQPEVSQLYSPTIGRVTRYTADPATGFRSILPGSRKVLLGKGKEDGIPILDTAHGTGDLVFGEDGSLFVSTGDGSAWRDAYAGGGPPYHQSYEEQGLAEGFIPPSHDVGSYRAQLLPSLNGKVLRIDPETGQGLPSNPYYDPGAPGATESKVWALGFRMPFRMAVRKGTGLSDPAEGKPGVLYVGDVSGGVWEELNIVSQPGFNYGWPLYDALELNPKFLALKRAHPFAPNPLYGTGGCDQAHFTFHDLLTGLHQQGAVLPNPCDSSQAIRPVHAWNLHPAPAVAWLHTYRDGQITPPTVTYPRYDPGGRQKMVPVAEGSQVPGKPFWGSAVTGAAFYEAGLFPSEYRGSLFVSDFQGWIRNYVFDANDSLQEVRDFYSDTLEVVDVVVGPEDGCLYFILYPDKIARICYGGNVPPVAVAKADTFFGPSPLTVQFTGSDSYDPQQQPLRFHWDFGDGAQSEEVNPSHTFSTPGESPAGYAVKLTVTDSLGAQGKASLVISLNNTPPQVEISSFSDGDMYPVGGPTWLPLQADVHDAEHSGEELAYAWTTYLHHNTHFHLEGVDSLPVTHTLITGEGCGIEPYWYRISLTVTDAAGLSTRREAEIYPDCIDPFGEVDGLSLLREGSGLRFAWTGRQEEEIAYYEVQQAPDPFHFVTVDEQRSQGAGAGALSYSYFDPQPVQGDNFFRLKVVGNSGRSYYSEAVSALFLDEGARIYPNPCSGILLVEIEAATGPVKLTLFNSLGQPVFFEGWESAGMSRKRLDLYGLEDGLYVYQLDLGYRQLLGKLVKITR